MLLNLRDITGGSVAPDGSYADISLQTDAGEMTLRVTGPTIFGMVVNLQKAKVAIAEKQRGQPFSDVPYIEVKRLKAQDVVRENLLCRLFDAHGIDMAFLLSRTLAADLHQKLGQWLSSTAQGGGSQTQ